MRAPIAQLFGRVTADRANAFVLLFLLDAAYRALLITIVPQRAYAILGSAAGVTLLYFGVSVAGLAVSLYLPAILDRVARGTVLAGATLLSVAACAMFASGSLPGLVFGLVFQTAVGAILEVLINVAMLDHVARRDLNRFEPRRLLYAGSAFVLGPFVGVALDSNVAHNLTFAIAAALAIMLLLSFHRFGLADTDTQALRPRTQSGERPNPLSLVPKFAAQPRLVLAWVLAIGRTGWWYMYFIYTPILVAGYGYSADVGGAIVSAGMIPMFLIRTWARLGARHGIRELLTWAYAITGIVTISVGLTGNLPKLSLALMCLAACCATAIDGAGNVPFLRAVRPLQRAQMTSVFMTFRHVASLTMPAMFTLVLSVAPLAGVFIASGVIALSMSALSRHLPRGL